MPEFLTADQIRAIEKAAIDSGQVTGLELMENAGQAVIEAILDRWPDVRQPGNAVVLCGPGNNGGDGFVIARLLHHLGWDVAVFFYGVVAKLPPDARTNFDRWTQLNTGATTYLPFPKLSAENAAAFSAMAYGNSGRSLVIDALFGIGLSRRLSGLAPVLERVEANYPASQKSPPVYHVCVDVPSGLAESGPIEKGPASVFSCDLTVTFHAKKTAHKQGALYCGGIVVKDIGL